MSVTAIAEPPAPLSIGEIITEKRRLLDEKIHNRLKGTGLLKETVYVTSDLATASFSVVQGIGLLTKASAGMVCFGAVSGIIGGALNIGQGLFLLTEAITYLKNGQYKQGARIAADGLLMIAIGAIMVVLSLAALGLSAAAFGAIVSLAAHPFMMPLFILLLVLPGLIQTTNHLVRLAKKSDLGSQILDEEKVQPHLERLRTNPEEAATLLEELSDEIGVEAAIEAMELLDQMLQGKDVKTQRDVCQAKIDAWNRAVKLRAMQLTLYSLTFPFGVAAAKIASTASKIVSATSKFLLTVPSSIGGYLDAKEPFKRNGAMAVPKVALPLRAAPEQVLCE